MTDEAVTRIIRTLCITFIISGILILAASIGGILLAYYFPSK